MLLVLFVSMSVYAEEKAVYVGEGRYACGSDSVDCAVVRQRNQEQTRRIQERDESDRRNQQNDRQEREYRRDYDSSRY